MSLRWDAGEPSEPEPGDLSVLQLLLWDGQTDRWTEGQTPRRDPKRERRASWWPYVTVRWRMAPGSPQGGGTGERRGLHGAGRGLQASPDSRARGSWGSCSMVSWSRRLVSWMSRSIWGQKRTTGVVWGRGVQCSFRGAPRGKAYLIQRDVADGGAVDLQDAVAHVDGVLHVRADAVWVYPAGPTGSGGQPPNTVTAGDVLGHCPPATPSQWGRASHLPDGDMLSRYQRVTPGR